MDGAGYLMSIRQRASPAGPGIGDDVVQRTTGLPSIPTGWTVALPMSPRLDLDLDLDQASSSRRRCWPSAFVPLKVTCLTPPLAISSPRGRSETKLPTAFIP